MLLPIIYYGNKLLRKKCEPIEIITDEIKDLVENMIQTMDAQKGIGLAAPQIGHPIRLFVLRNYIEDESSDQEFSDPQVYINPKILKVSKESDFEIEGCLSIPGVREEVERPLSILIEATDLEGKLFTEEIFGYNARVRLHENDHLNGVLFIDRIPVGKRKKIAPVLVQIEKKYPCENS